MHTVMYKNLELEIDDGVLCSMHNGGTPCEVIIPKVLPNGEQINKIGVEFLKGEYKLVVIPDEITEVAEKAFKSATVDEVVWSASCKVIPDHCFHKCTLKKLTNTDKVAEVQSYAF
ncbi:MAG: leucine-rich repeat domain-containing protein, partial [Eubacterium sp.]|nr:leucine-rich repeat domain-containing protein [Eubacterium sp.]